MSAGEYEEGRATAAVKDSSEAADIIEGLALSREGVTDTPAIGLGEEEPVKIADAGEKFYGFAQSVPNLDGGLAARHQGIMPAFWDGVGTFVNDDPAKLADDGEVTLWVAGADTADELVGFVEGAPAGVAPANKCWLRVGLR